MRQRLADDPGRRRRRLLAPDGLRRVPARSRRSTTRARSSARRSNGPRAAVIDMAGDSVLAVFDAATGAVNCGPGGAAHARPPPRTLAEDRRMRFRIGVHLGDVIEKSRRHGLRRRRQHRRPGSKRWPQPGGVAVSEPVQCAVRKRVDARFDDLGEQRRRRTSPSRCAPSASTSGRDPAPTGAARRRIAAASDAGAADRRRATAPTSRRSPCCRSPT